MLRPFMLPHSLTPTELPSSRLGSLLELPRATSMGLDCPMAFGQEEGTWHCPAPNPNSFGLFKDG